MIILLPSVKEDLPEAECGLSRGPARTAHVRWTLSHAETDHTLQKISLLIRDRNEF